MIAAAIFMVGVGACMIKQEADQPKAEKPATVTKPKATTAEDKFLACMIAIPKPDTQEAIDARNVFCKTEASKPR